MVRLEAVQTASTTFIMTVAGGYVALILRDAWRRFLRHRRMRREGLTPGQPITFLVMKKDDDTPKNPGVKH